MYQFYIVEIKKTPAGEYEHNVQWAWDANQDLAQRKAESKAYELLTEAALSNTQTHSVTVLSDEGFVVFSKCYHNVPAVEPEPESESEG